MPHASAQTALTRRRFTQLSALAAGGLALPSGAHVVPGTHVAPGSQLASGTAAPPRLTLEIAPYTLEASPRHRIRTVAYNGQVPGPLLRLREGDPYAVEIRNLTANPELVHWHGLFLPPAIDGAMEEGTPMIAPGDSVRYTLRPNPAGFRWYHTHTFAGNNLTRAQYSGLHGFLLIEPRHGSGSGYDREVFLALHDWEGHFAGSDDGYQMPQYELSTINGKVLGFGEPIRVRSGERVLLHLLNSSPTEVHWIALAGHTLRVLALDGNPVPASQPVPMLRLAPAERVSALVEMNNPGTWILGEVRRHIQAAGMGIVFEYANSSAAAASSQAKPVWTQPDTLLWNYRQFAAPGQAYPPGDDVSRIELAFDSRFQGHGNEELWCINGKSYPHTDEPTLTAGRRYRLLLRNRSKDDHPLHLHRHTFEVRRVDAGPEIAGLLKDVLLVRAGTVAEVEFTANNPGRTLFHCHQQDHMDRGFMMVFRYA
jgi:FtsP/CotA-like multicopper oxidase with cupredoxin domain